MKTSETIAKLIKALATFQENMPTLPKSSKGYGYNYTPLDDVIESTKPHLAAVGLAYTQMPSTPPVEYGPAVALTTRLMHESGEWIEDTLVIPVPSVGKANAAQQYGAALTYARRYALTSILGVATDEDKDGEMPPPRQKTRPQPSRPQPSRRNTAPPQNESPFNDEPRSSQSVVAALQTAASKSANPANEKQLKYMRASLSKLVGGDSDKAKAILAHVFNIESSKDATSGMASAIIDWAGATKDNEYTVSPTAAQEAERIYSAFVKNGQEPLFD